MLPEKWTANSNDGVRSLPSTIGGINRLPVEVKRAIYQCLLPPRLLKRFQIPATLMDEQGNDLFVINGSAGNPTVEISLYHRYGAQDPVLYGQFADTLNGQLHILYYAVNDPDSPRFDVDRMPDGKPTRMGTLRNLEAENAAMQAGLAPAQIRRGLRMLSDCFMTFEVFVQRLGHSLFFAEPLHYHNAVIFEWHGLAYEQGYKLMDRIQKGFAPKGDLLLRLDSTTPFRRPEAANSLRLRSWAIYDGILEEPFKNVSMYKVIGKHAGINTSATQETNLVW